MGPERMCVCGKKVSSMRRSDWCSSICKRQHDYEKRKVKLKGAQVTVFALVHRCIRPELQMGEIPDPLKCSCREEMPEEKLKGCIRRGEIVLVGAEGHACYSSKLRRAPRAQTVEKAHMERANLSKDSRKYGGRSLKDLQAAVDEDKASRALEEKCRIEFYNKITVKERQKLIVQIPAELFDKAKRESEGIPVLSFTKDERTEGGISEGRK